MAGVTSPPQGPNKQDIAGLFEKLHAYPHILFRLSYKRDAEGNPDQQQKKRSPVVIASGSDLKTVIGQGNDQRIHPVFYD